MTGNPRTGGPIWMGEDEAAEKVAETVEVADGTGRLRGILDAVRGHRVEDDFSVQWSNAREDFERKLCAKPPLRSEAKAGLVCPPGSVQAAAYLGSGAGKGAQYLGVRGPIAGRRRAHPPDRLDRPAVPWHDDRCRHS